MGVSPSKTLVFAGGAVVLGGFGYYYYSRQCAPKSTPPASATAGACATASQVALPSRAVTVELKSLTGKCRQFQCMSNEVLDDVLTTHWQEPEGWPDGQCIFTTVTGKRVDRKQTVESLINDSSTTVRIICILRLRGAGHVCGGAWADHIYGMDGSHGGRWTKGEVPFVIDSGVHQTLRQSIQAAVREFNTSPGLKTAIQWRDKRQDDRYFVRFVQNDDVNPNSHVGVFAMKSGQEIQLPRVWPGTGEPLKLGSILHEMCHTIGLEHEHSRSDRTSHVAPSAAVSNNPNFKVLDDGTKFGHYDYDSIMHYACSSRLHGLNEFVKRARKDERLSRGDRSVIRRLYGTPQTHYGEFHRESHDCKQTGARFERCYYVEATQHEFRSHWSCCYSNAKQCAAGRHTGFWHAGSKKDDRCEGGCTFNGTTPHWSCCEKPNLGDDCSCSPYEEKSPAVANGPEYLVPSSFVPPAATASGGSGSDGGGGGGAPAAMIGTNTTATAALTAATAAATATGPRAVP